MPVGQVFEVSEEKVLLRGDIVGTSDDREYRAHHRVFSQSLPVLLLEI